MQTKGALIFDIIKQAQITLQRDSMLGFTYETMDNYAVVWFDKMEDAIATRQYVNSIVGWPICSKPKMSDKNDDTNPFTRDVVGITLLRRDFALRAEKFQGDAMLTVIGDLIEAGAEIKML